MQSPTSPPIPEQLFGPALQSLIDWACTGLDINVTAIIRYLDWRVSIGKPHTNDREIRRFCLVAQDNTFEAIRLTGEDLL